MFEFLFCPQHGIFGAQNIALALSYVSMAYIEAQMLYIRVIAIIGRYL